MDTHFTLTGHDPRGGEQGRGILTARELLLVLGGAPLTSYILHRTHIASYILHLTLTRTWGYVLAIRAGDTFA